MHVFFFANESLGVRYKQVNFPQNVHTVLKKMSAISVCYIEIFLREFDRDSASSLKTCPLLPGVRYITCPIIDRFDCTHKKTSQDTAGLEFLRQAENCLCNFWF